MARDGFRLGRVLGTEVDADWIWALIVPLVTSYLAVAVFPQLSPAWGAPVAWAISALCALGYLGSVLVHELVHVRLAHVQGLDVQAIILYPFGGVPDTDRAPADAGAEFVAALGGPLTSLALGAFFLFFGGVRAANIADAVGSPSPVLLGIDPQGALLLWLGPVNILIGLLNLLPGFPLDGGRIVRATAWAATGDARAATRWTARAGQVGGAAAILAGFAGLLGIPLPVVGAGALRGLLMALLGYSLLRAAAGSGSPIGARDLLRGVPVSGLMRTGLPTVQTHVTVDTLVRDRLMGTEEQAFPVLRGEDLAGLVTLGDVRKVPRVLWAEATVEQVMTSADRLITIPTDGDAATALRLLHEHDVRQLPVLRAGALAGMVLRDDLLRWLYERGG